MRAQPIEPQMPTSSFQLRCNAWCNTWSDNCTTLVLYRGHSRSYCVSLCASTALKKKMVILAKVSIFKCTERPANAAPSLAPTRWCYPFTLETWEVALASSSLRDQRWLLEPGTEGSTYDHPFLAPLPHSLSFYTLINACPAIHRAVPLCEEACAS